jgi:hypothetical protein
VLAVSAAQAQVADAALFRNLTHEQTSSSVVTDTGGFFNATLDSQNAGDFGSVVLTDPGPASPESLNQNSPTNFGIGPSFPDQASMDAAYPMGTYQFDATGGSAPDQTVYVDYNQDGYALNTPALDAASFDALQGVKRTHGLLTLNFNAQDANGAATSAFTFFTIFGSNQGCGFLSPSATSCTIDTHALAKGQTYDWELDFSNRIENSGTPLLGSDFDVRTDGTFTTGVPEPATWAMLLIGLAGLGGAMRGRRGAA